MINFLHHAFQLMIDSKPQKFEPSCCKSQKHLGKDTVDDWTKWAIERGKECLILYGELMHGKYHDAFQMRLAKATTKAEVIQALCDYDMIITTTTNEQTRCLATQYIQECLNTIFIAFSNEESHHNHNRTTGTVNPDEHSTSNTSNVSVDVTPRDHLSVGGSQSLQGKMLESNKTNCSRAKTIGVVDKLISEGKAMVSPTTGKNEHGDDRLATTISCLQQSPCLSISESAIVMPAIVSGKQDSDSSHQGRFNIRILLLYFMTISNTEDTDQLGQPTAQHDQIGNQGGNQGGSQENQTASQSNHVSQAANQDEIVNPKDQATNQEGSQNDPTSKESNQSHMNSQGGQITNQDNQIGFLGEQQVTSKWEVK